MRLSEKSFSTFALLHRSTRCFFLTLFFLAKCLGFVPKKNLLFCRPKIKLIYRILILFSKKNTHKLRYIASHFKKVNEVKLNTTIVFFYLIFYFKLNLFYYQTKLITFTFTNYYYHQNQIWFPREFKQKIERSSKEAHPTRNNLMNSTYKKL